MTEPDDDERVMLLERNANGVWEVLPWTVGDDRIDVSDAKLLGIPSVITYMGKPHRAWVLEGNANICYASVV
jgi:hypothetical protein